MKINYRHNLKAERKTRSKAICKKRLRAKTRRALIEQNIDQNDLTLEETPIRNYDEELHRDDRIAN